MRSHLRKLIPATIAILFALALAASASTARGSNDVTVAGSGIASYHWKPGTVTIDKGQKVHWSWSSNARHNVTFRSLGEHSRTRATETYSLKFNKPGTYHFLCTVHGFKGKVIVK